MCPSCKRTPLSGRRELSLASAFFRGGARRPGREKPGQWRRAHGLFPLCGKCAVSGSPLLPSRAPLCAALLSTPIHPQSWFCDTFCSESPLKGEPSQKGCQWPLRRPCLQVTCSCDWGGDTTLNSSEWPTLCLPNWSMPSRADLGGKGPCGGGTGS